MTKARFLTVGWNNLITLGVGLVVVIYTVVVLPSMTASDIVPFIGLVVLGVLY